MGNDTTAVTLSGAQEATEEVKRLIEELLTDSPNLPIRTEEEYGKPDAPQIDFNSFDWTQAAQHCVSS